MLEESRDYQIRMRGDEEALEEQQAEIRKLTREVKLAEADRAELLRDHSKVAAALQEREE